MANMTHEVLLAEIKKIMEQAEKLHVVEVVLDDVCKKIKAYNLSADELGIADKIISAHRKSKVKFRDPISGATWTGRGKEPVWIKNSGRSKEEFAVLK